MSVDLSPSAAWRRVKPFMRAWLVLTLVWWAYLSWGYWGYKIPEFDPKPVDPSSLPGKLYFDIPADYYSPEQVAYREQLDAYVERRKLLDKAFRFSLPISIPMALWGGAAMLMLASRWVTSQQTRS